MVDAGENLIKENIDPLDKGEAKSKKIEAFYYKWMRNRVESFLKIYKKEKPCSIFAYSRVS